MKIVARCMVIALLAGLFGDLNAALAQAERVSFREAKTWFQTNLGYDPRIAIATDAVVVHRHGDSQESMTKALESWKAKGFAVGRMFFSDSDATTGYWKGKWDGTPHDDEVEKDAAGNPVLCSGFRPYMLPTPGWTRYCEEQTLIGIKAGADAILPEEPLAHTISGHEAAFKPMFEKRFGIPWQPAEASPEAFFLTAQLKAELYLQLETDLARLTKAEARKANRDVMFFMPVHGLYSSRSSHLTSPLGMSVSVPEIDGYVGQVWTGPVRWALANYGGQEKSFFTSAYALYDYFVALTAGTNKRMYLLADPVEDDPHHKWSEFQEWYCHCLVAKLLFPEIDTYEVMPWPDRIFLPGYETGGSTPAPESYRIALLSALQVLQDVPKTVVKPGPTPDAREPQDKRTKTYPKLRPVGIAIGDSALWEPRHDPVLDGLYGLMLPLVGQQSAGVCLAERWTEPGYLQRFSAVVLSYENFKPMQAEQNLAMADWVKAGGVLVLLGGGGELKGSAFWWTKLNQPSPLHHLLGLLGMAENAAGDFDKRVGKGWVLRREFSPRQVGTSAERTAEYRTLVGHADLLAQPFDIEPALGFKMQRGPYTIAHACGKAMVIDGPVIDVLDAELPMLEQVTLKPGESGIYRAAGGIVASKRPGLLHCTHRLMREEEREGARESRLTIRGPAETPAAVRMFAAGRKIVDASVRLPEGKVAKPEIMSDKNGTVLFQFPNAPEGAMLVIKWAK